MALLARVPAFHFEARRRARIRGLAALRMDMPEGASQRSVLERAIDTTADSTDRRNTLIVEVCGGDEVLVCEDERGSGGCTSAVACGSGVAAADAFAWSAGAFAGGAAGVQTVLNRGMGCAAMLDQHAGSVDAIALVDRGVLDGPEVADLFAQPYTPRRALHPLDEGTWRLVVDHATR